MKSITIVKQYMEVLKTAIEGVVIIELKIFKDTRGYFFESFSQHEFEERVCKVDFVQDVMTDLYPESFSQKKSFRVKEYGLFSSLLS